jgi:formate dehydrogenase major subunit/formate dehydrogenase alpha subunit
MAVSIKIDGKPILARSGSTVLEIARENGIEIPTLCYHKDLSPVGSCRLCLVEVEGWRGQVAACTLGASEGMVVHTSTPALFSARRTILSLLLENYHESSTVDGTGIDGLDTEFMRLVRQYGAKIPEGFLAYRPYPVDADPNPFLRVDMNQCILCTRCVRACAEVQGRFVWGVAERGDEARIVAGAGKALLEARCESCGACVAYCPTGALENRMSFELGRADKAVTTTCTYCGVGCQFDLQVKNGKVIRVTSNPAAPVNGMHLCVKGRYGYDFIHHQDRLQKPRVRRYLLEDASERPQDRGDWVEVDWEIALEITSRKLVQTRDTFGPDSVGVLTSAKCLNEENYLMNKFARQVIGTNNIDHCARL